MPNSQPGGLGCLYLALCSKSGMGGPTSSKAATHTAMFTTVDHFYVTPNSFQAKVASSNIFHQNVQCAYSKQNSFVLLSSMSNKILQY